MARISKTICDRCGAEHIDGQQSGLGIDRLVFTIGRPHCPDDIVHTGRDLCMNCRDTTIAEVNNALDFTTKLKEL